MTSCTVLPVASGLHGADAIAALLERMEPLLRAAGAAIAERVETADTEQPLAVLLLTGGSEAAAMAAWRARQQLVPGEPLLLLAHAAHNSLPAALETLARLRRDGARGRILILRPEANGVAAKELRNAIHDAAVWHALHRARVGILGEPSEWLLASVPDPTAVLRRWGTRIVPLPIDPAMDRFDDNIDAPIAEPVRLRARRTAGEPHAADVETAGRFEPVLREVAEQHQLDAITVRCFDLVTSAHTSGCLALAALNDRGLVAGCEGDVCATMTMLWARQLTGHIGWMANPAMINLDSGVVELAHCTVPLSLVDSYELRTHFESGLGVGIAGALPAGPVTVLRLGGDELEKLWVADGEALPTPSRPGRCRTQLDVRIEPAAAASLLADPLGNHLVMIAGHHAQECTRWWKELIAD